jgi:5-amino-6-(5-phosphoribosylamino)uracil reductase
VREPVVVMADRPYTVLSCAVSLDGYLDDASDRRLVLSGDADLDRVDAERARSDAVLVGAATVRNDNPRLVVRSPQRASARRARGLPPSPVKVTVTGTGKLDPGCCFFTTGDSEKLVYAASDAVAEAREALGRCATVVDAGLPVDLRWLVGDLLARGVVRLLVEGGGIVLTQLLGAGLADELHLVVAPFFVGDSRGRRFVDDGRFPWTADRPAVLLETRPVGDDVLLRYALSARGEVR